MREVVIKAPTIWVHSRVTSEERSRAHKKIKLYRVFIFPSMGTDSMLYKINNSEGRKFHNAVVEAYFKSKVTNQMCPHSYFDRGKREEIKDSLTLL